MIARLAGRGHSFKGAGLYYLHDKEALTTDRVEWTQTRNMPIQDPEAAMKWMAYTSINSNKLKQEAGVPLTGRKRERGTVYTFSLSWSPEENPDKEKMAKSADETLEILGLQEHETVLVAHNDTDHPHVHMIVNLVSPIDGRMHDPDWGSKWKLSDWALDHEFENGKVFCLQRAKNREEREQGKTPRYQEPRHHLKEKVQGLYSQSDSGQSFKSALEGNGYTLARGNRRRFVLVDDYGKIYNLSRQLDKDQRKDHLQKLSIIKHQDLPIAQEISKERQYYDRDKYNTEWQNKIDAAAIEHDRKKNQLKKQSSMKDKKQGKESGSNKPKFVYDDAHLVKLDEQRKREQWADIQRTALENLQSGQYKRRDHLKKIEDIKKQIAENDNVFGRATGKYKSLVDELSNQQLTLESIDQRISEQSGKLEKEISEKDNKAANSDKSPSVDLEAERQQRIEALKKRRAEIREKPRKQTEQSKDLDKGHDLEL